MKEYKFSEATAKKIVRAKSAAWLPIIVTAFFGGFLLINYLNNNQLVKTPILLIGSIIVLLLAVYLGWRKGVQNGVSALLREKYVVKEMAIEKIGQKGDSINVKWFEVSNFQETDKGLEIEEGDLKLLVPKQLDGYAEVVHIAKHKITGE